MDEDWTLLLSFLPREWDELAVSSGALKGLRKDKDPESLLRVLLIHLSCGHSLRETAVRARQAGLADLSDVALMKRLRKSKTWLRALCLSLFRELGVAVSGEAGFQVRAFDATTVKEPGKTGALWRIHYSVALPALVCDHFRITPTKGKGTGETFRQFPVSAGDFVLADRGCSTAQGIAHVAACGGHVTVRVNTGSLGFVTRDGSPFDLGTALSSLDRPGMVGSWTVATAAADPVEGRVCAIRKSEEAIRQAHDRIRREAGKSGKAPKPETFEYARYVILFSTFPDDRFDADAVLQWYRLRWQVELVFKRFKSLAGLGHLPKHDDDSAEAWLYGKLLTALLAEKFIHQARAVSPWGYGITTPP